MNDSANPKPIITLEREREQRERESREREREIVAWWEVKKPSWHPH